MDEMGICIKIPLELQQYRKISDSLNVCSITDAMPDFGVKFIKNDQNELECAAYYSDTGELLKQVYYKGSIVSSIIHYRNNILYSDEIYSDGKLKRKTIYSTLGDIVSYFGYEYNREGQITLIKKFANNNRYEVAYGYDELKRVNSRKIIINSKLYNYQVYMYDILDRIIEYKDGSQKIKVHKINKDNELVSYTITDNHGNDIEVLNKFLCSEYIGTEIALNGHKTTVKNREYIDNALLKKPYTSDDDLDFAMSNLSYKPVNITTKRQNVADISDFCIKNRMDDSNKPLPISIRKKMLLANTA